MRRFFLWIAAAAAVMVGLPLAVVAFVRGDAGMAVCIMLFFAGDPAFSVAAGIAAGTDPGKLWSLPVLSALLFLLGTALAFTVDEPVFLRYAAAYLILGLSAMAVTAAVRRARKTKQGDKTDAEL